MASFSTWIIVSFSHHGPESTMWGSFCLLFQHLPPLSSFISFWTWLFLSPWSTAALFPTTGLCPESSPFLFFSLLSPLYHADLSSNVTSSREVFLTSRADTARCLPQSSLTAIAVVSTMFITSSGGRACSLLNGLSCIQYIHVCMYLIRLMNRK